MCQYLLRKLIIKKRKKQILFDAWLITSITRIQRRVADLNLPLSLIYQGKNPFRSNVGMYVKKCTSETADRHSYTLLFHLSSSDRMTRKNCGYKGSSSLPRIKLIRWRCFKRWKRFTSCWFLKRITNNVRNIPHRLCVHMAGFNSIKSRANIGISGNVEKRRLREIVFVNNFYWRCHRWLFLFNLKLLF